MNQPLSYVHPDAMIAKNVVIEPFTTIDKNVKPSVDKKLLTRSTFILF